MFSGKILTLDLENNISLKEKQILRKFVTENGGVVSYIVTKKVIQVFLHKCVRFFSCLSFQSPTRHIFHATLNETDGIANQYFNQFISLQEVFIQQAAACFCCNGLDSSSAIWIVELDYVNLLFCIFYVTHLMHFLTVA